MKTFVHALAALAVFAPAAVFAQLNNTGQAGWQVSHGTILGNTPTAAVDASLINPIPGVWSNNVVGANWIGADIDGTIGGSGDNVRRYRYLFQYTFGNAAPNSKYTFQLAWDNYMVGAFIGGSIDGTQANWLSGASQLAFNPNLPPAETFGFCRSGGLFALETLEPCTYLTSLTLQASAGDKLTFVVEGDGTTDGLFLNTLGAATVVPEPTSLALIGFGLVGVAGVARRRRAA